MSPLSKGRVSSTQRHQMSEWKERWYELLSVRDDYVFRPVSFAQLKFTLAQHLFLYLVFVLCSESCRRHTKRRARRLSEIGATLLFRRSVVEAFAVLGGYIPYVDSYLLAFRSKLWVPKRRESATNLRCITSQKSKDFSYICKRNVTTDEYEEQPLYAMT